jgi:hypothetical protein
LAVEGKSKKANLPAGRQEQKAKTIPDSYPNDKFSKSLIQ